MMNELKFFKRQHVSKTDHIDIQNFAEYAINRREQLKRKHDSKPLIVSSSDYKLSYTPKNTLKTSPYKIHKIFSELKVNTHIKCPRIANELNKLGVKGFGSSQSIPTSFNWQNQLGQDGKSMLLPVIDQGTVI